MGSDEGHAAPPAGQATTGGAAPRSAGEAVPQPGGGAASQPACAVVSGAASGIGRACAAALRADGLAIAALDLSPPRTPISP